MMIPSIQAAPLIVAHRLPEAARSHRDHENEN
jgi:hypothetical protein